MSPLPALCDVRVAARGSLDRDAGDAARDGVRRLGTLGGMAADEPEGAEAADVVVVHSATEDGEGARVVRLKGDSIEVGEVRPLEDGKPIVGEVVRLKPRPEQQRVCDVEVLVPRKAAPAKARKGPAQVASGEYRDNWALIFGAPKDKGQLH